MINNPRFENGEFIYNCSGEGCTSKDGTHTYSPEKLIISAATLGNSLLQKGDPRASAILFLAAYIRYTVFGNSSLDISEFLNSEGEAAFGLMDLLDDIANEGEPEDDDSVEINSIGDTTILN